MLKVNVIGLDSLKSRIDSASKELKTDVDAELQAAAFDFVALDAVAARFAGKLLSRTVNRSECESAFRGIIAENHPQFHGPGRGV